MKDKRLGARARKCEGREVVGGGRFGQISRRTKAETSPERNISDVFHPSITPGNVRGGVRGS